MTTKPFEEYIASEAQLAENQLRAVYERKLDKQRRACERSETFCLFLCILELVCGSALLGTMFC